MLFVDEPEMVRRSVFWCFNLESPFSNHPHLAVISLFEMMKSAFPLLGENKQRIDQSWKVGCYCNAPKVQKNNNNPEAS